MATGHLDAEHVEKVIVHPHAADAICVPVINRADAEILPESQRHKRLSSPAEIVTRRDRDALRVGSVPIETDILTQNIEPDEKTPCFCSRIECSRNSPKINGAAVSYTRNRQPMKHF